MPACGTESTRLVILRGPSASGKTTVARRLQLHHKGSLAVVGQDVLRRDVLKVPDGAGNPAIALIDTVTRHALNQGFDVVVEGILHAPHYGEMLRQLVADHRGRTSAFRWRLDFDETVARHATKPQAAEYGPDVMRQWYQADDPLAGLGEHVFDASVGLDEAMAAVEREVWGEVGRPRDG